MKVPQGIYNDRGYTNVRIWLGPKRGPGGSYNKPYRRTFKCWCNEHIQEAKNHIDEIRENFKRGLRPGKTPVAYSVPAVCDIYSNRWWENKEGRTRKAVANIRSILGHFKAAWPTRPFHLMLPGDIDLYIKNRRAAGASNSTIKKEVNILSTVFDLVGSWVRRGEVDPILLPSFNPCSDVERPSTAGSKRTRAASVEELKRCKAYCDKYDPPFLELIKRTIVSGLRKGNFKEAQGKKEVSGVLSKSRGRKRFDIPVDFSIPADFENFDGRWNKLRRYCGMLDFHWHDWRRTSGTILHELGFTDEQIRDYFDHSDVETTRIYIAKKKERLRPQIDSLKAHLDRVFAQAEPFKEPVPVLAGKSKVCRGCGQSKDLTEYHTHNGFADGIDSRCKDCNRARRRAYTKRLQISVGSNARPGVVNGVVKHAFSYSSGKRSSTVKGLLTQR